jgi:hypothetical protein
LQLLRTNIFGGGDIGKSRAAAQLHGMFEGLGLL